MFEQTLQDCSGHVDGFPQSKCRWQVVDRSRARTLPVLPALQNSPFTIVGRVIATPLPLPRRGRPPVCIRHVSDDDRHAARRTEQLRQCVSARAN